MYSMVFGAANLGLLVSAIAILLIALYILWRRAHGLDIFYDNNDQWCHHFNQDSVNGKDAYFTRLKVVNNSRATANCYGHLRVIKDRDGNNVRWTNSCLGWERQKEGEVGSPVAIAPSGDYKYLDIVWVDKGEDKTNIRTNQESQGIDICLGRGQYYFQIVVSDEKLGTVKQWFMVRWLGDYTDFRMKKVRELEVSLSFLRRRLDRYGFPPVLAGNSTLPAMEAGRWGITPKWEKERFAMMYRYRSQVFDEISKEREYQIAKYGNEMDRQNTPNDWLAYVASYIGRALTRPWNPSLFRSGLIKVAAVCVAAVEWCDRTNGHMPRRHYD
jgi:hypothetical protein